MGSIKYTHNATKRSLAFHKASFWGSSPHISSYLNLTAYPCQTPVPGVPHTVFFPGVRKYMFYHLLSQNIAFCRHPNAGLSLSPGILARYGIVLSFSSPGYLYTDTVLDNLCRYTACSCICGICSALSLNRAAFCIQDKRRNLLFVFHIFVPSVSTLFCHRPLVRQRYEPAVI